MKLLAIEMSRITSLFRMMKPSGQPYLPFMFDAVAERYNFANAPQTINELSENRIEFRHGLFRESTIGSLDIYNDGIVVSSGVDTAVLDEFINDFVEWLKNDYSYYVIETHRVNKVYSSTLLVESDRDMFKPFQAYTEIRHMIEKALKVSSNLQVTYDNFGLALSADQTQNPALKPVPFRFERKDGVEFSYHQYYASAPLQTEQHLEILQYLEQVP